MDQAAKDRQMAIGGIKLLMDIHIELKGLRSDLAALKATTDNHIRKHDPEQEIRLKERK